MISNAHEVWSEAGAGGTDALVEALSQRSTQWMIECDVFAKLSPAQQILVGKLTPQHASRVLLCVGCVGQLVSMQTLALRQCPNCRRAWGVELANGTEDV